MSEQMKERVAAIRERLAKATPGPWHAPTLADGVRHLSRNCDFYAEGVPEGFNVPGRQNGDGGQRDGEFIAHAPADLAFLLDELEQRDAAIRWALGEEGDFPEPPEALREITELGIREHAKGRSPATYRRPLLRLYWWRSALREKAYGARPQEEESRG